MVPYTHRLQLRGIYAPECCRSFKGYEEVVVPAVRPAAAPAGEELVRITDMEEWAQLAFAGYK